MAVKPPRSHILDNNCIVNSFDVLLAVGSEVVSCDQVTERLGGGDETVGVSPVLVFGLVEEFSVRQLNLLALFAPRVPGLVSKVAIGWSRRRIFTVIQQFGFLCWLRSLGFVGRARRLLELVSIFPPPLK